ncbi:IS1 family transposase [Polaribacter cellanae]|uniref:IS1 family transposase n=1 Tax=Polaribacter cellanae TaxID=2818493 RepID=A0A975H589_9FLAO|nr:IS1 family transposase [Polaribacter cellanae]QTE21137.1 IS1 family transposase [Polaribacter cellanae]
MKCKKCKGLAVKNGKQSNGRQRYYCKSCKCSFQRSYNYNAYEKDINRNIYLFLRESVGITATSRLLSISKTTVIKRIKMMASKIVKPILNEKYQYYELDEMRVVVDYKQNEAWITYAINRDTKRIVNFIVGRRTKRNLSIITKSVLQLYPKRVLTDRLRTYIKLIPKKQHDTRKKNTTIIERHNLTLRTHLKRLSRKTICFSKNFQMLEATLKLYIWGNQLNFNL